MVIIDSGWSLPGLVRSHPADSDANSADQAPSDYVRTPVQRAGLPGVGERRNGSHLIHRTGSPSTFFFVPSVVKKVSEKVSVNDKGITPCLT
jgi:hypothetical protein